MERCEVRYTDEPFRERERERELGSLNEIEMATDPFSEKLWFLQREAVGQNLPTFFFLVPPPPSELDLSVYPPTLLWTLLLTKISYFISAFFIYVLLTPCKQQSPS